MLRPKTKLLGSFLFIYLTSLAVFFPRSAQAIIFLPAIVLIPIANILVILIGGLTAPFAAGAAIFSKIFRTSFKKTFGIASLIFLLLVLATILFLKIQNPDRPWL